MTTEPVETVRFGVTGMICVSCVGHVTRALRRVDGVRAVKVDLRRETATVERDPQICPDDALATAVAAAGYQADVASLRRVAPAPRRSLLFWRHA